ncbi:MAG: hypothetical protein J6T18_08640 [Bacteroidaceae bacterium]|nr:hypothetical protein [Bacteroidaceae bacterium]
MKLTILSCVLMLTSLTAFGQNTLTVHQKNGEQFSFGFEDKPVVTFTETELVVKSTKTELRYELAKVSRFTFDSKESAVEGIKEDSTKASITLDEYTVNITGAKAGDTVRLIASDGRQLHSCKTDEAGSVTFSIAELPEGTYIISSESLTVKILKK